MTSLAGTTAPRRAQVAGLARERPSLVAVWGAVVVWSAAVFALVRSEYLGFRLAKFDLGNMVQAVWSTAHGRPLEITMTTGEQGARLAGHVDPILALLTPLWLLAPSPLTLAAVQVGSVALGALPVFWLARRHLASERAAALLALAYLANPWLAWTAHDAVHPKTFAIPLFLYAVWFLDTGRLRLFGVCAVLALASNELMGLSLAALGLWYAFARGRRRAGLLTAAAGAGWTLVALLVVIPAFSGGSSAYYGLYENVGGSPWGVLRTAVTDPLTILDALSGRNELLYVFLLAAPLLGTFLLAPWLAAVAVPQLLVNALPEADGPTDPRHHYIAGILPFLVAAAVLGLARLAPQRRVPAAGLLLGTSAAVSLLLGPWPGPVERVPIRYDVQAPRGHAEVLRRAVALVPEGAPVSSTNKAGSHLAARRYVYSVPVLGRAEWIVLDTYDRWVVYRDYPFLVDRPAAELQAFRERVEDSEAWASVFEEDGVVVYRKLRR